MQTPQQITLDTTPLRRLEQELPAGVPIVMTNLLRFRQVAIYEQQHSVLPSCTGREAYLERYIPAFTAAMAPFGEATVLYAGNVQARLAGPEEDWDAVALVKYPDIAAFASLMSDDTYQRHAVPHREAALAKWGFFATTTL